mmetsp:Transcript_36208/g.86271  ORF Transcript_36208/g.86271 Transcript_36208/m.86271 type:complete len:253 (-) Transcript_36208:69-827(-)
MRTSRTESQAPRHSPSNVSLPSMSASVVTTLPPVAFARRFRSSRLHRLAQMMPASTKYFMHRSSTPFVVRTTRAPASMIFRIRSFVMSISLLLMFSISAGSFTMTCTPIPIRWRWRFMSSMAILTGESGAPSTKVGMPCAALMALMAKPPSIRCDSVDDFPCAFSMCMADSGYLLLCFFADAMAVGPSDMASYPARSACVAFILTLLTASTAILAKNSDSFPMIFELMDVLAALIRCSSPRSATLTTISFLM